MCRNVQSFSCAIRFYVPDLDPLLALSFAFATSCNLAFRVRRGYSLWRGKCFISKSMKEAADEMTFTLCSRHLCQSYWRIGLLNRLS